MLVTTRGSNSFHHIQDMELKISLLRLLGGGGSHLIFGTKLTAD